MSINIENEFTGEINIPYEEIINKVVKEALIYESCPFECEVNALITDDEEIKKLNLEFRGLDRSTDVLSFPMIDYESPADFTGFEEEIELFNPDTDELVLGDIVLSAEHIYRQSEEYGHSAERELAFLTAHSMLHLMGYDHIEDEERLVMEKKQEEILLKCGYMR